MLSQKYTESHLQNLILPRNQWQPFPKANNRTEWEALPKSVQKAQITRGEERLNFEWPAVPATRFLDYARNGNRSKYEALTFGRRNALADLIIAECIENKGRFLDDITNGIWCICEESFWGVPAHIGVQKAGKGLPDTTEPIVDLFAAETSELLAWANPSTPSRPSLCPASNAKFNTAYSPPCSNAMTLAGWALAATV